MGCRRQSCVAVAEPADYFQIKKRPQYCGGHKRWGENCFNSGSLACAQDRSKKLDIEIVLRIIEQAADYADYTDSDLRNPRLKKTR